MTPTKDFFMFCEVTEADPSRSRIISEARGKRGLRFEALLQTADTPNRNKRVYSEKVLREALEKSSYIAERIKTKSWYGEAGHPMSKDPQRQTSIDHTRIAHIVESYKFDGKAIMGVVETARTAVGNDLRGLIEQGSIPGFSMRGLGSVGQTTRAGLVEVGSPLLLVCYDNVVHPSHEGAYLKSILSEDAGLNPSAFDWGQAGLMEALDPLLATRLLSEAGAAGAAASSRVQSAADQLGLDPTRAVLREGGQAVWVPGDPWSSTGVTGAHLRLESYAAQAARRVLRA